MSIQSITNLLKAIHHFGLETIQCDTENCCGWYVDHHHSYGGKCLECLTAYCPECVKKHCIVRDDPDHEGETFCSQECLEKYN